MLESEVIASLAPLASPLPTLPDGEVLTEDQWAVLLSLCDTFISPTSNDHPEIPKLTKYLSPSLEPSILENYLSETASSNPAFKISLHRKIASDIPPSNVKGLAFILTALNTRVGSLFLTSSTTPFHHQPLSTRTSILSSWSTARLPLLRSLFRSFGGLAKQTWIQTSTTLPQMIDFPSTPKHLERKDSFQFAFKQFDASSEPITLSTDVVIVGSGCGAGVCALNLATAGQKVLVLEKSRHFPSTHFPMNTSTVGTHLFENGGAVVSDTQSIAVLAGSTWGGGGTVNWSASLQPQHFVREEWASSGLTQFTTTEFQDCLDTVCGRMGVCKSNDEQGLSKIEQNFANHTLLEGARRLGYTAEVVPQNTGGKQHLCGYCGEGCASTTKRGPANYWLPEAAAHGAEFAEGCFVEEVVFDVTGKSKKATGVKGTWKSRDDIVTRSIVVNAKTVIVSSGTLNSPLLLMRSGLANPNIGKNLHLHPVSLVGAVWDEAVRPWEGAILTSAVESFENLDGLHHGPKIEVIASTPGYMLPFFPWRAPLGDSASLDFKFQCAKFKHMTGFISLQRDRDTGRVYFDPDDPERRRVKIDYTASERDIAGILAGVLAAARIAYVMGAREILSLHPDGMNWIRDDALSTEASDASFEAWLGGVKARGLKSPDPCILGSAHQMGTCRMGVDARSGVVDGRGKVWGVEGLYVADASVFPSASGVNPMVTTMGIAEWISRGLIREMK